MKKSFIRVCVFSMLSLLLFSGCLKSKVLVKINSDGSGNLVVTNMFSPEMIMMVDKQMEETRKQFENMPAEQRSAALDQMKDPLCSEEMVKMQGQQYGDVEFVQMKKVEKAGSRGYIAVFSFKDVSGLAFNLGNNIMAGPAGGGGMGSEKENITFGMTVAEGKPSVLKIKIPLKKMEAKPSEIKPPEAKPELKTEAKPETKPEAKTEAKSETAEPAKKDAAAETDKDKPLDPEFKQMLQQTMAMGNPFGFTGKENEDEILTKVFTGFEMSYSVEINGKIIKNDASLVDPKNKNRFTLLEMDFGKLLSNPGVTKEMRDNKNEPFNDFMSRNLDKQGLTVEKKNEITVEFEK